MDLLLIRTDLRFDGVLSELKTENGNHVCVTMTHSFDGKPLVPDGKYLCKRGTHKLKNGVPFETFEITGVDGHSGVLFHKGNINRDSEGCELTGVSVAPDTIVPGAHDEMVTGSDVAFHYFMSLQKFVDEFWLEVITPSPLKSHLA